MPPVFEELEVDKGLKFQLGILVGRRPDCRASGNFADIIMTLGTITAGSSQETEAAIGKSREWCKKLVHKKNRGA